MVSADFRNNIRDHYPDSRASGKRSEIKDSSYNIAGLRKGLYLK